MLARGKVAAFQTTSGLKVGVESVQAMRPTMFTEESCP